jgi:hypothetical protein
MIVHLRSFRTPIPSSDLTRSRSDFSEDGKIFLIDNIQRVQLHLLRSRLIF